MQPLSIYLVRTTTCSTSEVLHSRSRSEVTEVDLGALGTLFIKPSHPKPPRWAQFFAEAAGETAFGTVSYSAALLVLPVEGRLFAVAFGQGRHLLTPDCCEDRFGLRVALNSVDENKLRSIDKQTFDAIGRHSREQASREASAAEFGIDIEQDLLRGVVGVPRDSTLGRRMCGMDGLNVVVDTTLADLPALLTRYLRAFGDTRYRDAFPWVDQITEVTDRTLLEALDVKLVATIQANELMRVWMAVPEVIPWDTVTGFRYCLRSNCPEHHDILFARFLEAIGGVSKVTAELLRKKEVHCTNTEGVPIVSWSAYRCLNAEIDQDESFLLSCGKWYRISSDFVADVNRAYSRIPTSTLDLPEYDDASETAYNARVATGRPSRYALMDGKDVPYGGGHSSVEFCDLFTKGRELVHVKRYGSSRVLSHLFAQALVSGELFQTDAGFRRTVNRKLPETHRLTDTKVRPRSGEYGVVFAVIGGKVGSLHLPFFSKLNMKHAVRRLDGYGYRVTKLQIPVAELLRKRKRLLPR